MQQWLIHTRPERSFSFVNAAMNGRNSWANLVMTGEELLVHDYDTVIIDHANDGDNAHSRASLEALIRRIWGARPSARLILIESVQWNTLDTSDNAIVDTPYNEAVITSVRAIAAHYGIPIAAYWEWCKDVVPDPYDLTEIVADTVHPTALGYTNMALLVEAHLPDSGGTKPDSLPARLYDNGDYENTPLRIDGTDYDSRTGTGWADDGTTVESSTIGDTITYSATCQSYGAYVVVSAMLVDVSIDGGAFEQKTLYQNGAVIATGRGAHTITIRVRAENTVTIAEFWAI